MIRLGPLPLAVPPPPPFCRQFFAAAVLLLCAAYGFYWMCHLLIERRRRRLGLARKYLIYDAPKVEPKVGQIRSAGERIRRKKEMKLEMGRRRSK